jgi:hypothetical protein
VYRFTVKGATRQQGYDQEGLSGEVLGIAALVGLVATLLVVPESGSAQASDRVAETCMSAAQPCAFSCNAGSSSGQGVGTGKLTIVCGRYSCSVSVQGVYGCIIDAQAGVVGSCLFQGTGYGRCD